MNPFMVVKVGAVDIDVFSLPFDGEAFGDFNYLPQEDMQSFYENISEV